MYVRVEMKRDNYALGVKDELEVEVEASPEEISRTLDAVFGPPVPTEEAQILDLTVFGVRN